MTVPPFAELGMFHILDPQAWDHLLFVAALVAPFAPKDAKAWFGALTAFAQKAFATSIFMDADRYAAYLNNPDSATLAPHLVNSVRKA